MVGTTDLRMGMAMSLLQEVLPQLPPRKTSQNGGGRGGGGVDHSHANEKMQWDVCKCGSFECKKIGIATNI